MVVHARPSKTKQIALMEWIEQEYGTSRNKILETLKTRNA